MKLQKKKKKIFIFQARPLKKIKKINEKLFAVAIINLQKKIEKILLKDPNLPGSKNALSNMSDWNPAEMIGTNPTKLSFSLYSELITDEVWSKQRKQYNYKDVKVTVALGGSTSLDIYPTGWDKTYGLTHYPNHDIWFVGDRCEKGGNDWHIYEALKKSNRSFHIHSPNDTIDVINKIVDSFKT